MKISIPDSPAKVFKLSTPMHLLAKLRWEIAGFERSQRNKGLYRHLLPAYHAFNCAVTAWHMTDWIWEYVGPDSQVDLATTYKLKNVNLRSFQDAVAQMSRAINACQEIANGSKHREVRRKRADPYVRAEEAWAELEPSATDARRYGTVWLIRDQSGVRPALDVFREAADYWCGVLSPWMEDTFIEGGTVRGKHRRRAS